MLGATLALMAVAWVGSMVLVVGRFRRVVATCGRGLRAANRLAAVTFLGLAVRLSLERSR